MRFSLAAGVVRGEPALVDAAAVQAVGVEIVGMKLEPLARLEERARHPARREAQQASTLVQGALDKRPKIGINSVQGGNCLKHQVSLSQLESEALS